MTFRTLAITYVLGGLTFLPLLFAAILATAWYILPKVQDAEKSDGGKITGEKDGIDVSEEEKQSRSRQESFSDAGASGTFAVLRQYDFSSAVGALNARNNTGGNANVGADGSLMADADTSNSIYQSMYRSVFVGKKDASHSSLLDNGETQHSPASRRKAVPANVMYIVLRHGHLMLYDSSAQVEVKHVISLAHHKVTLQADKDGEQEGDEKFITEADLFTKRTAIVLTPVELPNGALQPSFQKSSRPFYLFCGTNIDKEDFYHALLAARTKPPVPRPMDTDALIKLQSALHSSSLTPETRALSAIIGRVFLGIHKTDVLVDFVRGKIEKKLRKIQKPSFIPLLEIRSLDLGDAGPIVSNMKLKDLNISGDTTISADIKYNGGLSLTLLAVAKLDLGPRFKARTVDLVVKTTVHRVSGTMLFRVKPVPSNRIWFTFESMPELDVRVEPVVSERKITYGFVLRAIEERVRAAFAEGLVKPNWDDVPMPLQDTRGSHARGGIWSDEGEEDHPLGQPAEAHGRHGKRLSTATLPDLNSATSTGLSSSSDTNLTKLRHTATMPVQEGSAKKRPVSSLKDWNGTVTAPEKSPRPPKPLRSPSISAMSPSVAVDDHSVERADDSSIRGSATPSSRLPWRSRGSPSFQQSQKDALEELRDLRDRAEQAVTKPSAVAISDSDNAHHSPDPSYNDDGESHDADSIRSRQHSDGSESTIAGTPRSFSMRSTDSDKSTNTSFSSSTLPRSQQLQQKKTTILAAAGAATNAARNWGWNTIQKNKGAFQRPVGRPDQLSKTPNEPMGRGQPLPPPGMPLPGPQKAGWGGISSMRRKPVPALPPRRPRTEGSSAEQSSSGEDTKLGTEQGVDLAHAEDEFEEWQENPGANASHDSEHDADAGTTELDGNGTTAADSSHMEDRRPQPTTAHKGDLLDLGIDQSDTSSDPTVVSPQQKPKKAPPPLPARRTKPTPEAEPTKPTSHEERHATRQEVPLIDIDDSATSALRVPEGAADAIAAENSTAELALGDADDKEHISHDEGVEARVEPDSHAQPEGHVANRPRSNTQQRFVQGEDVTEDDFEHDASVDEQKQQAGSTEAQVDSVHELNHDLAQRIKAQVQKHAQEDQTGTSWHGGPQGTAVDPKTS